MTLSKFWQKSGSSELSRNKVVGTAVAAAVAVYAVKKSYPYIFGKGTAKGTGAFFFLGFCIAVSLRDMKMKSLDFV